MDMLSTSATTTSQETLQEKFLRLVVNAKPQLDLQSDMHQNVAQKFANMSLQEMHTKVQEVVNMLHK